MAVSLRFHANHSKNIKTTENNSTAHRINRNFFSKGLLFTNRPIQPLERIYIKLLNISDNLGGFIYIGFTRRDPSKLPNATSYAGLTNKPGYWCWFFPQDLCQVENVLYFFFTSTGRVHYGLNGEPRGVFDGKISLDGALWGLVDIFGNSNAIQILDRYEQRVSSQTETTTFLFQPEDVDFAALKFNSECYGRHIEFLGENCVKRSNALYEQGVVFAARPVDVNEMVVLKILPSPQKKSLFVDVGVTACNPGSLRFSDLTDNVHGLFDRSEYWVLLSEEGRKYHENDEVSFFVGETGEVRLFHNGKLVKLSYVECGVRLWVFVNLYGSSQAVRMMGGKYTPPRIEEMGRGSREGNEEERECCVCFERRVDAVLFRCGHRCMCYECALQQWQGKGHGHCPFCRNVIKDVLQVV